ncbi:MAG TPA: PAS domain S-box protein, partial [Anaerolineales bacterium]|nr:PAS domain S-box protein [Anaerolineales bacterium]
ETSIIALQSGAQDFLIKGQVDGRLMTRAIQYAIQRKQTEMQLADARKFTEQILTSSPTGIFTYRLTGECLSANPAAAQMVGGTIEQLKSQNFHEIQSWKKSGLYTLAMQAVDSGRAVMGDVHVITSFGRDAWYTAQFIKFQSRGEELLLMMFSDITERKQTEAALVASEKRFRTWIEHSLDIITVLDASGVIQYVSPSTKRLLGYRPEELLGKNGFDFVHPEDQEKIMVALAENIQDPNASVFAEFRFRHKDGSWCFLEGIGRAYMDEHDEVVGLIHSRDITERRQAEAAVAAMQKRFQALIENAPDGIALLGTDGKLRQVTPSIQQILGYTLEEAEGQEPALLTHPDDLPALLELLNQLIQHSGKMARAQYRFKHKDGSWRWLESTVSNLLTEPSVQAIVFNYRDVTEQKAANEALKEKERLLSEAQHIGHIGSWSYDIASDTMRFSDEMYRLFDILPEEFQHTREQLLALVYPSDRPMAARWFEDIREATQSRDLSFRLLYKNGELHYLHCTGAVEFNSAANPSRFIGTAQDVTERRVAEIQISQQLKRLTALSEIDRAIISSFDQGYTLSMILSHMISQLQVDAVDILLLDAERNVLTYTAGQGFRTKMMESIHVRVGESHSGRAAKERRMIRIPDLSETTNLEEFNTFMMAEGFVSYIAVPLIVKGTVKGVLEVYQRSMLQPYQDWLDFFNTLAGQTAIAIENTSLFENLRATNQELVQAYDATIEGWSRAMDLRDRETEGHTQRVTKLTLELARAMGIEEARLLHIRRGALLHDIGKLGVPDQVLFKPGELTVEEREMIEKHVDFAYEMLAPIPYLKAALNIPYFHHEKWDGTGYPLGLRGEQIPLEARIFALVDVWDALLSDRPYRKAWTRQETIEYIRAYTGTHFDPRVVDHFLAMINKTE